MAATALGDRPATGDGGPQGDGHPAVALGALVATWAVAATAIVLMAINRPSWHVGQWYFLVDLVDAIVYGAVGWVLLSRISRPVVWIVVGLAFGGAVAAVSMQWTEYRIDHPDAPALSLLASAQSWAWIPGTVALILVAPWLVRRDPLDRAGRIAVGLGLVVSIGHVLLRWTDPFPWPDGPSVMPLAIERQGWVDQLERIDRWVMGVVTIGGLVAAAGTARRWRRSGTDERRGLGWLAIGVAIMSATFAPLALPASWTDGLPDATTPILHLVSQLFFPAALLVAVLGQRLWGLQLAVSRAVAWSLLTALLVAGYAMFVGVLGLLLPGLADRSEQLAAAALVAAAVDPLRRFVQRRVDHLVHGQALEPLAAIDSLGGHLGAHRDPHRLLSSVLDGIVDSMRLSGATIRIPDEAGDRIVAVGRTGHDDVELPLVLDDASLGVLVVSPRPGERLDQRSLRTLEALVPTVAVAVRLAITADELRASRARVVHARDDERAALRRELHDGLGPALAGIGYGIAAARSILVSDPERARELLDRMAAEIDARVEEVRSLARDLVPPVLVEEGLGPALVELAERHRLGGLDVRAEVDDAVTLGTAADSTLYGIAVEAVRNVARHAAARRCRIELRSDGRCVDLTIVDDGVGIHPDTVSGVGLQSMRERAGALRADFSIVPAPSGGTVVRVSVPIDQLVAS